MMKKTLQDVVKGVRSTKDVTVYVSTVLAEINDECKSRKTSDKMEAIRKLSFLYLLGYDIKPYAFNTIECMCSQDLVQKRVGYLGSNFSFGAADMQTLSTNQYIQDIKHKNPQVKSMALSSLASCPAPNQSQAQTIVPILLEQLGQIIIAQDQQATSLVNKFIATSCRLLVLSKRQNLDGIGDYVPNYIAHLSNMASKGLISQDITTTQVFCHVALEIAQNYSFEYVMPLVSQIYDILITAKQPWILIEAVRFFSYMARMDERVKAKIRSSFFNMLATTESKSLLMELSYGVALPFYDDQEMIDKAVKRMSDFIIPGVARTDANLKQLALRNLALIQTKNQGICMGIDNLASEIIKLLDDKDFNLRIAVLDVVSGLANQSFLNNIVGKLLVALKDTKQGSSGKSLKELHQIGYKDITKFKRRVIEKIVEMCSQNNYANVSDFNWLIDVLITLAIDYPTIAADICSQKLLDLTIRSDDMKQISPRLMRILIENPVIFDFATLSKQGMESMQTLSINGQVCNFLQDSSKVEIEGINKLLVCTYSSASSATKALVDAIAQTMHLNISNSELHFFQQSFNKLMEDNHSVARKPFMHEKATAVTCARVLQQEDMDQAAVTNNLLSAAGWIMGTFLCYQPAAADSVNIYDAVEILTGERIRQLPQDVTQVFLLAGFKSYIGMLYSYQANGMFDNEEVASQCVQREYFQQFAEVEHLSQDEVEAKKAEMKRKYLQDIEREAQENPYSDIVADPDMVFEVEETKLRCVRSLARMFSESYVKLIENLLLFKNISKYGQLIDMLVQILRYQSKFITDLASQLEDSVLNDKLARFAVGEGVEAPTLELVGGSLTHVEADHSVIPVRRVTRPEFAFENGRTFSLDIEGASFLSERDVKYEYEEFVIQEAQKKRRHHDQVSQSAGPGADAFQAFVGAAASEVEAVPVATDQETRQMAQIFGAPAVQPQKQQSIFILNKSNFQDRGKVELQKYTGGIRLGAGQGPRPLVPKPQSQAAQPQGQAQPQADRQVHGQGQEGQGEEGKKKRRRHHKEGEEAEAQQGAEETGAKVEGKEEPKAAAAAEGAEEARAKEEPAAGGQDDMLSLFM